MHERDLSALGPLAVIVMGVSGSGKSTVAAALAREMRCPFLEGDDFHSPEAVRKMSAGIPLTDEDRRPWLDRLGRAIDAAAASDRIGVASCSALKKIHRDWLRQVIAVPAYFVLLDPSRAELERRLAARADHFMPQALLADQLETLERPQPDERALTLEGAESTAALCEAIVAWLRREGGASGRR
jgi:gluconokinase